MILRVIIVKVYFCTIWRFWPYSLLTTRNKKQLNKEFIIIHHILSMLWHWLVWRNWWTKNILQSQLIDDICIQWERDLSPITWHTFMIHIRWYWSHLWCCMRNWMMTVHQISYHSCTKQMMEEWRNSGRIFNYHVCCRVTMFYKVKLEGMILQAYCFDT